MADPEPAKLTPEQRRGVFVVWLIIFIDLLGFGIVLPSLAYYVQIFTVPGWAESAASAVGLDSMRGGVLTGLIMTAYSLFQFVFAPIWGRLSDRVGRKPILVMSTAGFAATWVMFALAPSLAWLLISRALAGVFAANLSTAQAYMADTFPPSRRAKGMGLIGMAIGLGFVFGPAIGAGLVSESFLALFYTPGTEAFQRAHLMVPAMFAAGLSLTAFVLTLTMMRESLPKAENRAALPARESRRSQFARALRAPGIGTMLLIHFVVTLGFANLEAMFSQFNADHIQVDQSFNGWVFVAVGLTLAFVQGGLIGRLTAKLGSAKLLAIGLCGLAGAMVLFGFQKELNPGLATGAWLILCAMLIGLTNALCTPSTLALISTHVAREAQGGMLGISSSVATLGRIIGPLAGGIVYDAAGPQYPFLVGAVLIGMGFIILLVRFSVVAGEPGPPGSSSETQDSE